MANQTKEFLNARPWGVLVQLLKTYNSDWNLIGFAAVGDATPTATLNNVYVPTENGTIFGQTVSDYSKQVLVGDGASFVIKNTSDNIFIAPKDFENTQLDFSNKIIDRGSITNTGVDSAHAYRARIGNYIACIGNTELSYVIAANYSCVLCEYTLNNDRTFTLNNYRTLTGSSYWKINKNTNYLRFVFLKYSGSEIQIPIEEVNAANFKLNGYINFVVGESLSKNKIESKCNEIDSRLIGFNEIININNVGWEQGTIDIAGDINSDVRIRTKGTFMVNSSAVFTVNFNNAIGQINVWSGAYDYETTTPLGWFNNGTKLTIPTGHKFIRLLAHFNDNSVIAPTDGENAQVKLFPSASNNIEINNLFKFRGAKKIWELPLKGTQGAAYYNGYIFQGYGNGDIDIFEVDGNGTVVNTFKTPKPLSQEDENRINSLCFSNVKYDSGDTYPLLWIPANDGKILGIRIQQFGSDFTSSLIYEVNAPYKDGINATQHFDFNNNIMVQVSYQSPDDITREDVNVYVYSFTELNNSTVFSQIGSFELAKMWAMQDGFFFDGRFYLLAGVPSEIFQIFVVDIYNEIVLGSLNLREDKYGFSLSEEPEGIFLADNNLYVSTTQAMYRIFL